jgi:hypothetical protein
MHVHGHDDIGVGASIDRAIVIIVLGDKDPTGSRELLFQVMSIGLLLLSCEGGDTLSCLQDSTRVFHVAAMAVRSASHSHCAMATVA